MSDHTAHPASLYLLSFDAPTPLPTYSISPALLYLWGALDVLLLAVGTVFASLALAWMNPDPMRGMVLDQLDLFAGLALGALFLVTFILSLPALLQMLALTPERPFSSSALKALNWLLVVNLLCVIIAGAIVWWRTLQERSTFFHYWEETSPQMRAYLQDKFGCCGYYRQCTATPFPTPPPICVDPITAYADSTLNAIFTVMFASSGLITAFFLCTGCVIAELRVLERYRKIDQRHLKLCRV